MGLGSIFEDMEQRKAALEAAELEAYNAKSLFHRLHKRNLDEPKIHEPMGWWSTVRASSLPFFCPREEAIRSMIGLPWAETIEWPKRWVMDRGTGIHHAWQNEVLPTIGAIDGMWLCLDCGHLHGELEPVQRPDACEKCSRHSMLYREYVLVDSDVGIRGHADGIWCDEGALLEIKTCGLNSYRRVVEHGPPLYHRVQAGWYLRQANSMLGVKGLDPLTEVRFIYVPMDDVCRVATPLPGKRDPWFEMDPDTKSIMYPVSQELLSEDVDAAVERVLTFRRVMKLDNDSLPPRDERCRSKSRGGSWKFGCDLCEECFAMGDKFEESKVPWLTASGAIRGDIAPDGVLNGGGEISMVGARVEDPDGLLGEPGATYTVKEGLDDR